VSELKLHLENKFEQKPQDPYLARSQKLGMNCVTIWDEDGTKKPKSLKKSYK